MLEYVETSEAYKFKNWVILLQEYYDNVNEKSLFNIAIEYDIDEMESTTIDIMESYNYGKIKKEFKKLVNNIKQANTTIGK